MKTIFLIRHGETDHNIQDIFQHDLVSLNNKGIYQSEKIVDKLDIPIEIIFVSPLQRALETANVFSKKLDSKIEVVDTLKEFRNPSSIRGKRYDEPVASELYHRWINANLDIVDEDLRLEGAESYFDLFSRAQMVISFLAKRSESSIAVVSHSMLIRAILVNILYPDADLNAKKQLIQKIKIRNTTVTQLRLSDVIQECRIII